MTTLCSRCVLFMIPLPTDRAQHPSILVLATRQRGRRTQRQLTCLTHANVCGGVHFVVSYASVSTDSVHVAQSLDASLSSARIGW